MIHAHWQLLWRNSIWQPSFLIWRKIGKLEIFLKSLERPILMTISIKKEIPLNFCPASTTYLYFCFFESFIPSMNQGKQSFLWRRPLNINGNATFTVMSNVNYFDLVRELRAEITKYQLYIRWYRMMENCERKSDPTIAAIQAVPHQSSSRISV